MLDSLSDGPIPIYSSIRHVPKRYHQVLPIVMMKRYQCVVIGSAKGVLTVAITNAKQLDTVQLLRRYTGKRIFTVLIEPARMRLLISRIERCQKEKQKKMKTYRSHLLRVQLFAIVRFYSLLANR